MVKERYKETSMDSFFGNFLYEQRYPKIMVCFTGFKTAG